MLNDFDLVEWHLDVGIPYKMMEENKKCVLRIMFLQFLSTLPCFSTEPGTVMWELFIVLAL